MPCPRSPRKLVLRGRCQFPAQRHSAQFRIHQHRAIAVVPAEAQQSGLSRPIDFESLRQFRDPAFPPVRDGSRNIAGRGKSCLDARTAPDASARHHAAHAGHEIRCAGVMAIMQVEVPTTLTTSPARIFAPDRVPMRVDAPTGIGMPARSPSRGPLRRDGRRILVEPAIASAAVSARTPVEQRIDRGEEFIGRKSTHCGFHIHLWPMRRCCGATASDCCDAASVAATMSQCSSAVTNAFSLARIVPQPVQQPSQMPHSLE